MIKWTKLAGQTQLAQQENPQDKNLKYRVGYGNTYHARWRIKQGVEGDLLSKRLQELLAQRLSDHNVPRITHRSLQLVLQVFIIQGIQSETQSMADVSDPTRLNQNNQLLNIIWRKPCLRYSLEHVNEAILDFMPEKLGIGQMVIKQNIGLRMLLKKLIKSKFILHLLQLRMKLFAICIGRQLKRTQIKLNSFTFFRTRNLSENLTNITSILLLFDTKLSH